MSRARGGLESAHKELAGRVLGRPGVSGTAIGQKGGRPCLKVYVTDAHTGTSIPRSVGGHPVVVEKSGGFKRY